MKVTVRAMRNLERFGIALYGYDADVAPGNVAIAQPVIFHVEPRGAFSEPMLVLTEDQAQTLMNDLWGLAIRPSEHIAPKATQEHIRFAESVADRALRCALKEGSQ